MVTPSDRQLQWTSGGHRNTVGKDEGLPSNSHSACADEGDRTKRKRFRRHFIFKKTFLEFLKSSKNVKKVENSGNLEAKSHHQESAGISKKDENWIRIQVPYSVESEVRLSSVSEVEVEYNPSGDFLYNEKAVDVPEDFVRNQWICRRRLKPSTRCTSLHGSIQDFLREDWISPQNSVRSDRSHISYSNYELTNAFENHRARKKSTNEMGAGCSTGSVAPIQPIKIINGNSVSKIPTPRRAFESKRSSYPELFNPDFYSSTATSSSIEEDNILHRCHNVSSFQSNKYNSEKEVVNTKSKTSPRLPVLTDSQAIKYRRNSRGFLKNFSGSVQNLVTFGKAGGTLKSASENNLSQISERKLNRKANSVVFNGAEFSGTDEKNVKISGVKKFFDFNFPKMKRFKDRRRVIQDIDGGFFERFGSLLRQKSQLEESHLVTPLAPLPEEDYSVEDALVSTHAPTTLASIAEAENDSGTGTLHESDSEPDEAQRESFIGRVVGMNIDELYEEILYEIINNIGCEASPDVNQDALYDYVQEAFKITNERHEEILQAAGTKEPPEIRLNVELIKAENLVPKDSNGFSDPFVTLYLESCTTHRYNTSVKTATLNPLWEEHFSLPIPENPNNEILVVEVWDFDAAETVSEKFNKFFEVKGVRGLRKLMKEIAVTASTGKHDNEFIGRTAIPLKTIPASGIKVWYNLEKGSKTKSRGSILIRMSFSAEKNNRVAMQEHKHLLRILLMHELEDSKVAPFWWRGKFSAQGEAILTQHSAQSGLTLQDCAMAQWFVYAQVHQDHQLAFALFNTILDKIVPILQIQSQDSEVIKSFWEGAIRLMPSCFSVIRKIRKKTAGDKNCIKMLGEVLDIISKISILEPPADIDLFPKQVYGWTTREDDSPSSDIRGTIRDAVNSGAVEWFEHINEGSQCPKGSEEDQLQHLIKLIQLIRTDLQRAIEYYDKLFQQKVRFHYAQILFMFYEKKLAEQVQPVVEEVCRNIKRLRISEEMVEKLPEFEEINMGTTLFELYLVLKRFTMLGTALCPGVEDLCINQYHIWFTTGVSHWLDISVYKALTRIEKAIDLDRLIPVDETVKYSSSAVDTLAIFYQIKIFWQQLGWPDVEGAYMFVGKIVDDICRCCVYYADKMSKRVETLHIGETQDRFEVTREWCLAINNIDYIRQSLSPFIKELGVEDIITRLGEYRSSLEADRCAQTLKNVVENAIDTERNKIIELIEVVASKMSPAMRRFLMEGAEVLHEGSHSMERLMIYLEDSLQTLHTELNEVNFERVLDAIWTELSAVLYEVVQSNLNKRRPPAFFANLRDTLHIMVTSFKLEKSSMSSDKETLENIERTLELHAYETADLIHQYYLERLNDQLTMSTSDFGELTVRCNFNDDKLEIEIMNGRNLVPMDSNGSCDSFVKIHFIPNDKFLGMATYKTSVQNKTLFPLYDEKFSIPLTPEQRSLGNALMVFSVKDKDLFGMSNQYIAECYLSFGEALNSEGEQMQLKLSRPVYTDTDCVHALEFRSGDKQAREFIKKLKQKYQ